MIEEHIIFIAMRMKNRNKYVYKNILSTINKANKYMNILQTYQNNNNIKIRDNTLGLRKNKLNFNNYLFVLF